MYGLPATFDASEFTGKELLQVCFTANTISLSFEDDIAITIMGSFIYHAGADTKAEKQMVPVSSSILMCLAGKQVRLAEAERDGTLTLYFDNNHILTILDDSKAYESYSIRIGAREIIV